MLDVICRENNGGTKKEKNQNNKFTYFGWFERVICWEVNREEKYSPLIWTLILKKQKQKWDYWQFFFFLPFCILFVVRLYNDILRTGPIIVACQWNTKETK